MTPYHNLGSFMKASLDYTWPVDVNLLKKLLLVSTFGISGFTLR